MNRYEVTYEDNNGDISSVWVRAACKGDAEYEVLGEHWNIREIICIEELD